MDRLENIFNAFKLSTLVTAAASLIFGILGLYAFVVAPAKELHSSTEANLGRLTETYVQLKSQDLSKILSYLNQEVEYLKRKQEQVFSQLYSIEEIPTLVSKIERDAERAGLSVSTQIIHGTDQKKQQMPTMRLDVSFAGTFAQLAQFFNLLANRSEMFLIDSFQLRGQGLSVEKLDGRVQFLVLMKR